MLNLGITGQSGFIGTHLANYAGLHSGIKIIPFYDELFSDAEKLQEWVKKCDKIVHLAAVNRHVDNNILYETNTDLVKKLITAFEKTNHTPHVIFSSSTQETRDNIYGQSKRICREMLADWASKNGALFTGMVIPNVFGPFGNPYYNSVVATFSYQLIHNELPIVDVDAYMKLIYVGDLSEEILEILFNNISSSEYNISHTTEKKVSELLAMMQTYKSEYLEKGIIPSLKDSFEVNLFNTFRSYINYSERFPVLFDLKNDERGFFAEVIKCRSTSQVSFSTTKPGITRGNHFHLRKVERFAVIRGQARIELRRIGTNNVISFNLSGENPSYVDMPVWFTHNITNTGSDELITIFWVNEFFDPGDNDTYIEPVHRVKDK